MTAGTSGQTGDVQPSSQHPRRIFAVYGTRPEAIKLIPLLVQKDLARSLGLEILPVFTGQHRDMVRDIHQHFGVEPRWDLDLMRPGQSLNHIAATTMARLQDLFMEQRPDGVIVQGDTTSAFAAAVAAFYVSLPVFHVEAGLRSGDLFSPFPEEFNRRGISLAARLHFAPTALAAEHLAREGFKNVVITGNTAIDTLRLKTEESLPSLPSTLQEIFDEHPRVLLVTLHRRESFGEPMREVMGALSDFVESREDVAVVYFAHPNPEVQKALQESLRAHPRVFIKPPADYFTFVGSMVRCFAILSDSGGVQEEAPFLGKPVLVARDNTERPEGVAAGSNQLVSTQRLGIMKALEGLWDQPLEYAHRATPRFPYGDGHATEKIFAALRQFYSED